MELLVQISRSYNAMPVSFCGDSSENVGGFGDVQKAANVFICNELHPLQHKMQQLNEWLGEAVIQFTPYAGRDSTLLKNCTVIDF